MRTQDRYSPEERAAVYRAIRERRDIRHFADFRIQDDVLWRLLEAAHAAPSVGFMQPWDFIVIRDAALRKEMRDHVAQQKRAAGTHYTGKRAELYSRLKLEGLAECSAVIAVTCDPKRGGSVDLGRVTMPQTAQFSAGAAIENLWLAARAEGLGVGWVSIVDPAWVKAKLGIPGPIELIALLCLGAARAFPKEPLLQSVGWREREPLPKLVHSERWGQPYPRSEAAEAKR